MGHVLWLLMCVRALPLRFPKVLTRFSSTVRSTTYVPYWSAIIHPAACVRVPTISLVGLPAPLTRTTQKPCNLLLFLTPSSRKFIGGYILTLVKIISSALLHTSAFLRQLTKPAMSPGNETSLYIYLYDGIQVEVHFVPLLCVLQLVRRTWLHSYANGRLAAVEETGHVSLYKNTERMFRNGWSVENKLRVWLNRDWRAWKTKWKKITRQIKW